MVGVSEDRGCISGYQPLLKKLLRGSVRQGRGGVALGTGHVEQGLSGQPGRKDPVVGRRVDGRSVMVVRGARNHHEQDKKDNSYGDRHEDGDDVVHGLETVFQFRTPPLPAVQVPGSGLFPGILSAGCSRVLPEPCCQRLPKGSGNVPVRWS